MGRRSFRQQYRDHVLFGIPYSPQDDPYRKKKKSFRSFSHEDILSATNNFSDKNLITENALGQVYKGHLSLNGDVMNFTVRRLCCTHGLGDELQTEISTLKSLNHKNIISIFGTYDENNEKIIIYEHAIGTLHQFLDNPSLTWYKRLQICLDVAHALNYIHSSIIHCDINSYKVLLDKYFEPKIYGFELSTKYSQSWWHGLLNSHYFNTNNVTPKYDVYSFGVLLLEVLCGRKPMITNDVILEELDEIIDPNIRNQMDTQSLAHFKIIAYNCLNQQLEQRPTMYQIVKALEEVLQLQQYANHEHSKAGTSSHKYLRDTRIVKWELSLTNDRQRFKPQLISLATEDFSNENLITEDASGKVYKGKLFWNEELMNFMVRKLDCTYGQGEELQMEISMVKSFEHKNIISILGYNDEHNANIIVYEHAVHGTLDQHLSDPSLKWLQRLKICLGVASALSHIHCDIIHCDIKSSKIFLDEDWEPKIYGFELSTKYPQSWRHRLLYSHYFNTDIMTPKYDVYSFGVLLVEVLCERKPPPSSSYPTSSKTKVYDVIRGVIDKITNNDVIRGVIDEIIDPYLTEQANPLSLAQFKDIAYNCLNRQFEKRPTMDQILKGLQGAWDLECEHPNLGQSMAPHEGTPFNILKVDFLKIPLFEIKTATKNFHDDYYVGYGGYGKVYKAKLPRINKVVAIKRIFGGVDKKYEQGFLSEIELLSNCKHQNVVSLLGFSREADEMILVYEFASNGSLSDYLGSHNLTWAQRIQICLGIAHGIDYIHTEMEGKRRIIHRDIKSDNILLDENLHAKVADFGLSKFQAITVTTKNLVGTRVYIDPEYLETGKYRKESDIYSFGVVLFEVLSGSMAYDSIYIAENEMGLAPIARRRSSEGTLKELLDPKMIKEDVDCNFTLNRGPNQTSFNTFSEVARRCLAETQTKRPTMKFVIKELQKALELQGETLVLLRFQLRDIRLATENFDAKCCIGLDTDKKVYKAKLDHFGNNISCSTEGKNNGEPSKKHTSTEGKNNGEPSMKHTVAIKCIKGGKQAFLEELEMRTSYKHTNIVSLIGFCYEVDNAILVYEHAKRSLDDYLKSVDSMKNFTWTQRLHMCLEIARGLNHLHTSPQKIIHGDIKSANILLGMNHEAKIAYFGISKHPTNQEVGMKVYADPEYETTGKLETHSDVYSFGVVLFEIFCGRVAYSGIYMKENKKGLAPIACKCVNDGSIERIIDPKLIEETDEDLLTSNRRPNNDSLYTFLKVACQCTGEAANRPTMEMVINELEIALTFHEKPEENTLMEVQQVPQSTLHMNQMQQLPTNDIPLDICSIFTQTLLKLFRWRNEAGPAQG